MASLTDNPVGSDEGPSPAVLGLSSLYHDDETAWLEAMSRLVAERRHDELDCDHLSEFLADMAQSDRREVLSRLTTLLMHLLKWEHRPEQRSRSWIGTIVEQRQALEDLFESGTLRNYGRDVLDKAYGRAVARASGETGLDEAAFPEGCPYSSDEILSDDFWPGPSAPAES